MFDRILKDRVGHAQKMGCRTRLRILRSTSLWSPLERLAASCRQRIAPHRVDPLSIAAAATSKSEDDNPTSRPLKTAARKSIERIMACFRRTARTAFIIALALLIAFRPEHRLGLGTPRPSSHLPHRRDELKPKPRPQSPRCLIKASERMYRPAFGLR